LKDLPDYRKITFPHMDSIPFEHLLADASPEAIALLKKFLVYSPSQRISAREVIVVSFMHFGGSYMILTASIDHPK
jgi:serine/threonine protein kinase